MNASRLAEIGQALGARAAGIWRVADDGLSQVAFWAAPDLPGDVAESFTLATRHVSLSETGLGIVRAALENRPIVSLASELPPESGSGLWLRRFGAERSVAVPTGPEQPRVVISVALPPGALPESEILSTIRSLS